MNYEETYRRSIDEPEAFWGEEAKRIHWHKPPQQVLDYSNPPFRRWFVGGETNLCYNAVDRHLAERADQLALVAISTETNSTREITYRQLYREVNDFAAVLKHLGVGHGDRVVIYMPNMAEAVFAMLACARIGAVHSVVFGGFSPDALAGRIIDCESTFVITADEGMRGGKPIPLKDNTDKAIDIAAKNYVMVKNVLVVRRTGGKTSWAPNRDLWYHEEILSVKPECKPEKMKAEDPLFILYTSGSTGKPKGVLHTTGGYLVYASMTHQYVFDYHDGDIYWCTADVGWVTGHSYIVYGPLANGATTLMFEGVPNYPSNSRFWEVIDKHKVNIFYTAPTAIRSLMGAGDEFVTRSHRSSLRLLGTVGEPINPEAWQWYHDVVGQRRCPIIDTWWQTEQAATSLRRCRARPISSRDRRRRRSSVSGPNSWTTTAMSSRGRLTETCASRTAGPARCARSTATTTASFKHTSPPTRASTSREMAAVVTRTATTGSRGASTTCSTCRAIASGPRKWNPLSCRTISFRKRRSSATRMPSRGKASTAT